MIGVTLIGALGLFLAERAGLKPLSLMATEQPFAQRLAYVLLLGSGFGVLVAVTFDVLSMAMFYRFHSKWIEDCRFDRWKTFCGAALGAGVAEELVFRLVLLSGLIWAFAAIWPTHGFWLANLIASLLMSATHLPIVGSVVPRSVGARIRLIVLVTAVSMILGYAYRSFGLEVAVLAHAVGLLVSWLLWAIVHRIRGHDQSVATIAHDA